MWLKSSGILLYDPQAKSIEAKKWWLILQCCEDLGRYYRKLHSNLRIGKLMKPAWNTHISIIRGEEPPIDELWGLAEGVEYEFEYKNIPKGNEEYYWLDVSCPRLLDIREQLGLPREPKINLHLTFGRTA